MVAECHDQGGSLAVRPDGLLVALVGSPNAGKTTLFNALTGLRAKTANYPGITVTRREAAVALANGEQITLVDLPGVYSLRPISPDEEIVAAALHGDVDDVDAPDALVVVADATSLERSLFLVAEILALGRPTCLVLSMVDELEARHGHLDEQRLAQALGIPVVKVIGHRGIGVDQLRELLEAPAAWSRPLLPPPSESVEARGGWVDSVLRSTTGSTTLQMRADQRTRRIDAVLLHPIAGSLIFIAVMLGLFQSIFTLAAPAMDWIDGRFVALTEWVERTIDGTLGEFLGNGVIAGVGGVLVFLPQIAILFALLAILEKVGYLSRAAFLADRVMGRFGLEGRSFVALLSSFACAVPGIMATRTIPGERRRLATMLAAPLMTCSARLPIFTLLISAFVPDHAVLGPVRTQGLAMFGLYVLGGLSGLVYAAVMSYAARRQPSSPVMLELPPYRWPTWKAIVLHIWEGVWSFLRRAGTIILLASVVLWALLRFPSSSPPAGLTESQQVSYRMEHSIAGRVGHAMEPVFSPLGFEWRTNVAVLGSLAAREVFVSTLALTTAAESEDRLGERLHSVTRNDGSKVFDAPTVAAILIFFVYALQCLSTIAVLRRETNSRRWPAIAFVSMFGLAYAGALIARWVTVAVT